MPPRSRHLFRIFGIDIDFDASWFIILFLIAFSLAGEFQRLPGWTTTTIWGATLLTTALFFACLVLHELAHSLVARSYGIEVHGIRLYVFGGVSQITSEPKRPGAELLIAIVGPLTSLALGGGFTLLAKNLAQNSPLQIMAEWLGIINLILGVFNLIPGFPLDGGRILRALIWTANHNFLRATLWATRVGKVIAIGLILIGIVQVFQGGDLNGLWLAFIGWFLLTAADQSMKQTELRDALTNYAVRDLSSPFFSRVEPEENLEEYFARAVEQHDYQPALVMENDELLGIISPSDLRQLPRENWARTTVRDIMTPREQVTAVSPRDSLGDVLDRMTTKNLKLLPVLEAGRVQGVIGRDRILQLVQNHFASHQIPH